MSRILPTRVTLALQASMLCSVVAIAAAGQAPATTQSAPAGSSLPTSQTTAQFQAQILAQIQAQAQTQAQAQNPATGPSAATAKPEQRLDVVYANDKLTVNATNASLNQLLRDITQKTGMKISGGVSEEKVFGHYGPSPVADVLVALLDGTENNVLLVENQNGPSELVLTPRRGGVTPPSSNTAMAQDNAQEPQDQYVPPVRPFRPPVATGRGPVAANPDGSPALSQPTQDETNSGPPGDSTDPKTPQEIFERLQAIEAQKPASPEDQ